MWFWKRQRDVETRFRVWSAVYRSDTEPGNYHHTLRGTWSTDNEEIEAIAVNTAPDGYRLVSAPLVFCLEGLGVQYRKENK